MTSTFTPFFFRLGQSRMPLKAPAMPRELIQPRLSPSRSTAQDSRALLRSEEWNCLESRNAQLVFLADFAEIESGITFETQELAGLFQETRSSADRVLYKARSTPKLPHRPMNLTLEQEDTACQLIRNGASIGPFLTSKSSRRETSCRFPAGTASIPDSSPVFD
jgi:hypothetical protein